MVTAFGKFCRLLRIKHDKILCDMARELEVSSSYLSAVENGKRSVPQGWRNQLIQKYSLTSNEIEELDEAIYQSLQEVTFNLNNVTDTERDILIAFARQYDNPSKVAEGFLEELLKKGDGSNEQKY